MKTLPPTALPGSLTAERVFTNWPAPVEDGDGLAVLEDVNGERRGGAGSRARRRRSRRTWGTIAARRRFSIPPKGPPTVIEGGCGRRTGWVLRPVAGRRTSPGPGLVAEPPGSSRRCRSQRRTKLSEPGRRLSSCASVGGTPPAHRGDSISARDVEDGAAGEQIRHERLLLAGAGENRDRVLDGIVQGNRSRVPAWGRTSVRPAPLPPEGDGPPAGGVDGPAGKAHRLRREGTLVV